MKAKKDAMWQTKADEMGLPMKMLEIKQRTKLTIQAHMTYVIAGGL